MSKQVFQIETTVTLKEIGEVDVHVDGTCEYLTDSNYGADADGNRGIFIDWCENFDFSITNEETEFSIYQLEPESMKRLMATIVNHVREEQRQ